MSDIAKVTPPQTQQVLLCWSCSKYGQQRKSHRAGTYRVHHTRTTIMLTCKTCGKKLYARITKAGIQYETG